MHAPFGHSWRILLGLLVLLTSSAALAAPRDYTGYKVVGIHVRDAAHLERLESMTETNWTHDPHVGDMEYLVSPAQLRALRQAGEQVRVRIQDIQPLIDAERREAAPGGPWFTAFHNLAEINAFIDDLVAAYPDKASIFDIGDSLEGRPIRGIHITGKGAGEKPAVVYHGLQHAREWITGPMIPYIAEQLLTNYDSDPYIQDLVDRVDWYLIPCLNPDGYEYTWTNERFWRKNRRNNGGGSFGVDLNRNWAVGWGGEGSSGDPNSEVYRGPSALSEPETQAITNFMLSLSNVAAYMDYHSFGQLLLWPWGYTPALPPDQNTFNTVGQEMVDLIQSVHGRSYAPGPVYTTIYPASGVSVDWSYEQVGALAFTIELRGNDFVISPDEIIPTAEENLPAILHLTDFATAALLISLPNDLPTIVEPGVPTDVFVRIEANAQTVDVDASKLMWRLDPNDPFQPAPLTSMGGDIYQGALPPANCDDQPQFYFLAVGDGGGEVVDPQGAPASFYSTTVGDQFNIQTVFTENFQTDTGWTVSNEDLADGAWERGVPANGGVRGDPPNDFDGSGQCFITGNGTDEDVDGGPTRLLSPAYDLSGIREPLISYARWFTNDDGDDRLIAEISNDNGQSWRLLESAGDTEGWLVQIHRVADYVAPTDSVRLRFTVSDNPNDSVTEAGIDAIGIHEVPCKDNEAFIAAPTGYERVRGAHVSGDLASLFESDDDRLVHNSGITIFPGEPPVWIEVDGVSPAADPASLSFIVESHSSTPQVTQTVELFNYDIEDFEIVDVRDITGNDASAVIVVDGDAARFVDDQSSAMHARLTYQPPTIVLTYPWSVSIDQAVWSVVP